MSFSNNQNQFPTDKILEIIDNAKKFEKGKNIDALRKIAENYNKKEYHTKPSKLLLKISSTGETAYQRAIFLSRKTQILSLGEIVWNDLELPVVFNENSRRRCVDLVGTLNNKTPVLCELKFASPKSKDSPIYAVIELLIYYYLIEDNCEELDKKKVFHKNGKPFKWKNFNSNSIFIVAANKKYWDDWQKQYEEFTNDVKSWCSSLPLKIRFFSSADFDFKEQKGIKSEYTPSVFDKMEWTEVYLCSQNITERQIVDHQRRNYFKDFKEKVKEEGYVNKPEYNLLANYSNWGEIKDELGSGNGNELKTKFLAFRSSSALCVNNFALLKENKDKISFCDNTNFNEATFEKKLSTRISTPNLDFYLENEKIIIGIESKFTEHFRKSTKHTNENLSKYYKREELSYLPDKFNSLISEYIKCTDELYLDVAQLIKHIAGLINNKGQKNAALIYLYWQPENWEDFDNCKQHIKELNEFSKKILEFNDIITFKHMSYNDLWKDFESSDILKEHLVKVKARYNFEIY